MLKKFIQIFPVFSGICFGSAGIFVRELSARGMDSYTVVSSRTYVAIIILAIGMLLFNKELFRVRLKDVWVFICSGILGTLGVNLCYNMAIEELTLSLSAVLLTIAPVFVVFFAAVFYALYSLFSKIAMQKGYQAFTITFYSMLAIGIALLPFTDWRSLIGIVKDDPITMSGFMILHSLFTSVFPYTCYTVALNYMEAGKASILCSCEPVAATFFGVFFFGEVPTVLALVGLAVTLIALGALSLDKGKIEDKSRETKECISQ
ncbi:MAG TPA: DMT family transporter [Candidatus Scybalomonas excrementigallinarum]|nr:DMT family transporter [Candidatus Scybalomonas excrementigallinarum]